jgi:hypothetical protein
MMASSQPQQHGYSNDVDHSSIRDHTISTLVPTLSLSSKTIHADDYLNRGPDVAPPLHVSTTFRYSRDPNSLQALTNLDVSTMSSMARFCH